MFQITTSTHPSADLSKPSVILTNLGTGKKYLFGNVTEGTQRIINENKLGLNKIDDIFLTGKIDWDSISGLPGFVLTSADQGRKSLSLNYAGYDKFFKYIISTWRYFIFRFGLKLSINEYNDGELVDLGSNTGFKVRPISIHSNNIPPTTSSMSMLIYDSLSNLVDKVFPVLDKSRGKEIVSMLGLPDIIVKSSQSCNYIIEFNSIRGRFLVNELKKLGVPMGPMFSRLSKGENVTLSDGTVVYSKDVMEPQREYGKVVILDIPDESFLEPTLQHQWGLLDKGKIELFYHFLGDGVKLETLKSSIYTNFFDKYPDSKHFISHSKICSNSINFHSSALFTLKLKCVNNELFRLPRMNLNQNLLPQGRENVMVLNSLQKLAIKPLNDVEYNDNESNTLDPQYWETLYNDQIDPSKFHFHDKSEILSSAPSLTENNQDIEIITLGTGSALPSKYRNVISTVLRFPKSDNDHDNNDKNNFNAVILDAGENTIGSMRRLFSEEELKKFFQLELSMIYLSHLHADHHLGIISLINEFNRFNVGINKKLYVICPWQYDLFLKEWFKFNDNSDGLVNVVYLNCELFEVNKKLSPWKQYNYDKLPILVNLPKRFDDLQFPQDLEKQLQKIGILNIKTCKAIHCDWAYSVSIEFITNNKSNNNNNNNKDVFKVSYSGDTRPSIEFVKIGKKSDLLIHESTLEDELVEDLIDKRHTTILELKHVLLLMDVKKLVLTHFSQRYPRLPVFGGDDHTKENKIQREELIRKTLTLDPYSLLKIKVGGNYLSNEKILYAFDNMWFKYNDIHLQYEKFNSLDVDLYQLFKFDEDEDEVEVEVESKKSKGKNKKKRNNDDL